MENEVKTTSILKRRSLEITSRVPIFQGYFKNPYVRDPWYVLILSGKKGCFCLLERGGLIIRIIPKRARTINLVKQNKDLAGAFALKRLKLIINVLIFLRANTRKC